MKTLKSLSNIELVESFRDLVIDEPADETYKVEHVVEMELRKIYYGKRNLRDYLMAEFQMPESTADRRVRVARLMIRFPGLTELLRRGKLDASLLDLAQACANRERLSEEELWELLLAISGKSTRSAGREIARLYPDTVSLPRDKIRPLTEELSEMRCVVKNSTLETLDEIRGLLAHVNPGMTLGEIIERVAEDYRERHHPEAKAERAATRAEKKSQPIQSPSTLKVRAKKEGRPRRFSQAVLHKLTLTKGYGCHLIDPKTGKPCGSTHELEADHIIAWADGGASELHNARWLCAQHHRQVSFQRFGAAAKYYKPKQAPPPSAPRSSSI